MSHHHRLPSVPSLPGHHLQRNITWGGGGRERGGRGEGERGGRGREEGGGGGGRERGRKGEGEGDRGGRGGRGTEEGGGEREGEGEGRPWIICGLLIFVFVSL